MSDTAPGTGAWTLEFHDWGKIDAEDNPALMDDADFKFKRSVLSSYYATKSPGLPMLHLGSCFECSEAVVAALIERDAYRAALEAIKSEVERVLPMRVVTKNQALIALLDLADEALDVASRSGIETTR